MKSKIAIVAAMIMTLAAGAANAAAPAIGAKPAGCPSAWCGCFLMLRKGEHDRRLWAARAWAGWGHPSAVVPGAVVVFPHHVVEVLQNLGAGMFLGISGNDGHAVRIRPRSTRGAIAVRS